MGNAHDWGTRSRRLFELARDTDGLAAAVVTFHRQLDDVLAASIRGHAVRVDCARGCSHCCHLRVDIQPAEAFVLAAWLRANLAAPNLAQVLSRLRDNVQRIAALGPGQRDRTNVACALLEPDGACAAYEVRPAQCRKMHSVRVSICEASRADPSNDAIESPEHPVVGHNAAVIIAQARQAIGDSGRDAAVADLNPAVLEALENPKAERRWRSGKKAFVRRDVRAGEPEPPAPSRQ